VWSGAQWQYIGQPKDLQGSTLNLSSGLYGTTDANGNLRVDIPSGLDARGTAISPFDLTVTSDPLASLGTVTNSFTTGGIAFTPSQAWTTGALTASPMVYGNLQAEDMSSLVTETNLWQTRQTVLKFNGQAGCPPVTASREVILNQTNYALVASTSSSTTGNPSTSTYITAPVALRSTSVQTRFYIHGNAAWKASPTPATAANLPGVLGTYTTSDNVAAGADKSDNTKVQPEFAYTVAAGGPGTKYKTVDMVFSDAAAVKRAPDVTVTFMQCLGSEDLSSVTKTATPEQTAAGDANWNTGTTQADKVVRHQAKPNPAYDANTNPDVPQNIYEEFYSADFGPAGRWSNIRAPRGESRGGSRWHGSNSAKTRHLS
jgi:hypothetical protein